MFLFTKVDNVVVVAVSFFFLFLSVNGFGRLFIRWIISYFDLSQNL